MAWFSPETTSKDVERLKRRAVRLQRRRTSAKTSNVCKDVERLQRCADCKDVEILQRCADCKDVDRLVERLQTGRTSAKTSNVCKEVERLQRRVVCKDVQSDCKDAERLQRRRTSTKTSNVCKDAERLQSLWRRAPAGRNLNPESRCHQKPKSRIPLTLKIQSRIPKSLVTGGEFGKQPAPQQLAVATAVCGHRGCCAGARCIHAAAGRWLWWWCV